MKNISVQDLRERLNSEAGNEDVDFINVCTPAEYNEEYIEGVRNVPLDTIASHIDEFANKKRVYVHCRSGNRSAKAIEELKKAGVKAELINVTGGLLSWNEANFPTSSNTNRLPIMRQVLLTAGLLILLAHGLFFIFGAPALFLSGFIGLGLFIAGVTGHCGMAIILSKMPWNK